MREEQLKMTVEWCNENDTRWWSPVKSEIFLLAKGRHTVNKRLNGETSTEEEKTYCWLIKRKTQLSAFLELKEPLLPSLNQRNWWKKKEKETTEIEKKKTRKKTESFTRCKETFVISGLVCVLQEISCNILFVKK